jgi:uncharacterized protein (TIGR00255 family)
MVRSMTGYGAATASRGGVQASSEIRSYNAKGCDISTRLPDGLAAIEPAVCDMGKAADARGKVVVSVRIEGTSGPDRRIDMEAARRRAEELRRIREQCGLEGPVGIAELLMTPGIFAESQAPDVEELRPAVCEAVGAALKAMVAARDAEGRKLEEDIGARRRELASLLEEVEKRCGGVVETYRQKLKARSAELAPAAPIDDGRLEREVVLFAERSDIGEEVARMHRHLAQLDACLRDETPGRKLEFIAQEMLRETGTLAAKANDGDISRTAVDMKTSINRIREQAANVE